MRRVRTSTPAHLVPKQYETLGFTPISWPEIARAPLRKGRFSFTPCGSTSKKTSQVPCEHPSRWLYIERGLFR